MLRDYFSDEDEEEDEETTTVASSSREETTANWRKRGFKRKRIKRPRSGTELKRRRGGSQIKSFVPVGSGLLSSYRCKDQSVSDSGFAVVVASSDVVVVSSSNLVVVVSALLRIRRL